MIQAIAKTAAETRKKSPKVRERIPNPTAAAQTVGPIVYPLPFQLGSRCGSGKPFKWPNHETRRVALAVDSCPQGSAVSFRLGGSHRFGITKTNPFFQNGKLWVFVCGYDQAFQFTFLRVVAEIPPMVR